MSAKPKVLVVLTSHSSYKKVVEKDGKETIEDQQTGWYLPELAHPYNILKGQADIVIASPAGGEAPLDKGSVEAFKNDPSSKKFLEDLAAEKLWKETKPLKDFVGKSSEFAALFYPGGHGPMFDLHNDENSIKLIQEFYNAGKPVSAVCHGPIVFAEVKIGDKYLVDGRKVTGFTDSEEAGAGLTKSMPVLLETRLKERGAVFDKAADWQPQTVVDGQIITGQNPASATGVGEALAKAIGV